MHPHKPDAFLTASGGIPALMPQAQRLLQLRRILIDLLPDGLGRSCSIANYKHGKLVIFAVNSAVAAKLKLLSPALCERLSKRGFEVTGMDIGVQPQDAASNAPEKRARLTEVAAASVDRLSSQLPESPLKACLSRLAGRIVSKR